MLTGRFTRYFTACRAVLRGTWLRLQSAAQRCATDATRPKPGNAGFTLVELLVVMVILVMLASIVAPRVIGYIGSSRSKTAKVQIEGLVTAVNLFRLDGARLPTASEGLRVLVQRPTNITAWNGPYLSQTEVPKDPWGNPYHYKFPGEHQEFDIYSLGADNQKGGTGENADVTSW